MTSAFRAAGTVGIGSTTVTPGAPAGLAATDICFIFVSTKPDTATINIPAGWSLAVDVAGGGGTTGAAVGPTRGAWLYREGTGAMPAISITSGSGSAAQAFAYSSTIGNGWTVTATSGVYGTAATVTAVSAALGGDPGITVGDRLLVGLTSMSVTPTWSAQTVTAPGLTTGAYTERSEAVETTTGNDTGGMVFEAPAQLGTATGVPTVTATASAATRGVIALVRMREVPAAPPWPPMDASAPATIKSTATGTYTTAAFNCPANACIVLGATSDQDNNAGATPTVTDNTGGKFTWTRVVSLGHGGTGDVGVVALFQGVPTNPGVAPGSMTVTVNIGHSATSKPKMIRTSVYTSDVVDITDPVGAFSSAAFGATITSVSASLTPETTDGGIRMMWLDWNATGVPTTLQPNTQVADFYHNAGLSTNIQLAKSSPTVTGVAQTIGANFLATTSDGNWIAYELRAPSAPTGSPASGTGSLTLSGTAGARGSAGATGALALSGTAGARATAAATGALTLAGTATAGVPPVATSASGALTLSGTAGARGVSVATGTLSLSGTAGARGVAGATGSLTLTGTGGARATGSATGSLTLSGTGTAEGVAPGAAVATGSLSLSGAAGTVPSSAASGTLLLSGSAGVRAAASGSGALTLSGTAGARGTVGASGSLTLSGSGAARVAGSATGALTLSGIASLTGEFPASATGSLSLSGSAGTRAPTAATGALSLSGTAGARATGSASGTLSLSGVVTTSAQASAVGTLTLEGAASTTTQGGATGVLTLSGVATASEAPSVTATGHLELLGYVVLVKPPDLHNPHGSIRVTRVRGTIRPNGTGSVRRDFTRARIRT